MFWDKLLILCNEKNISPNKMCADLGLSNATATRWKKGSLPRGTTLLQIAEYFGISAEELLSNNNEQKEKPLEELKEPDEKDTEILAMYSRLSDEQKKQALSYLEYLAQHKASEDTQ